MNSAFPTGAEQLLELNIPELVDTAINRYGCARSKLIPILQSIQKEVGYLPRIALELVSSRLGIPLSEILAVVSFYHQFRLERVEDYVFQVCHGTACYLKGASEIYEALRLTLGTSRVTIEKARCFGCCSLAPVVMVVNTKTNERTIHGRLNPGEVRKIALRYLALLRGKRVTSAEWQYPP